MGDFAAGKLLKDGLADRGEITQQDIMQCLTDIEDRLKKFPDALKECGPQSTDTGKAADVDPHLAMLLTKYDGFPIFEFKLSAASGLVKGAEGTVIGEDMNDDGKLTIDPSGAVRAGSELKAPSFGAYLESFRDQLLGGKLEWCSGWVAKG